MLIVFKNPSFFFDFIDFFRLCVGYIIFGHNVFRKRFSSKCLADVEGWTIPLIDSYGKAFCSSKNFDSRKTLIRPWVRKIFLLEVAVDGINLSLPRNVHIAVIF